MKKAVILAAGWGTRLTPLTCKLPKPAIRLLEDSLLEHNLKELSGLIDEAVIVIGYKGEVIQKKIGEEFAGIKIKYAKQKEQLGTGHATQIALPFLDEEFLILNGDDLYSRDDIKKCLSKNPSILLKKVEDPSRYGQVCVKGKVVSEIVEKPETPVSNLVNIGCYFLNKEFFKEDIEKSSRGEYEIIDYLKKFISCNDLYFALAKRWYPITYPWNIIHITENLLEEKEEKREGLIEEQVTVKGKLIMEKGSVIRRGSVVEGPTYIGKNSVIGPNARIGKYTSIHDNCVVEDGAEIVNSVIFSKTIVSARSFVRGSVIGERCNIGKDILIPSFFSNSSVKIKVKGKMIDTKRKKMGGIIGDDTKIEKSDWLPPGVIVEKGDLVS